MEFSAFCVNGQKCINRREPGHISKVNALWSHKFSFLILNFSCKFYKLSRTPTRLLSISYIFDKKYKCSKMVPSPSCFTSFSVQCLELIFDKENMTPLETSNRLTIDMGRGENSPWISQPPYSLLTLSVLSCCMSTPLPFYFIFLQVCIPQHGATLLPSKLL